MFPFKYLNDDNYELLIAELKSGRVLLFPLTAFFLSIVRRSFDF